MYKLPKKCPETLEHTLLHVKNILDAKKEEDMTPDVDQLYHEASMAFQILSNIIEKG